MTGYAALSEELALGTLSVEIRSVNHRYLDLTFRLPDELRSFEPGLREMVAARLTRGKVECRVGFQKSAASQVSLQLNTALLEQLVELDRRVRDASAGQRAAGRERRAALAGHPRNRRAAAGGAEGAHPGPAGPSAGGVPAVARARRREAQGPAARARRADGRAAGAGQAEDPAAGGRVSGAAGLAPARCRSGGRRGPHPAGAGAVLRARSTWRRSSRG